ncbi:MAG TPA: S8 family peptidase [Lysobacter sp.]|nr:S8 family peptidase [Lysobacter sp.]
MNKMLSVFGGSVLAVSIATAIGGGTVSAAARHGVLPVKKGAQLPVRGTVRETAFNSFIVGYPSTPSIQSGTNVVSAVTNAAARVGLYGLRATATGTKKEFKVSYARRLGIGAHVVTFSHGISVAEANALAAALKADGAKYAHPNYRVYPQAIPNDPQYNLQWDFSHPISGIMAEQAWDVTTGAGTIVAVIDTGYVDHQDLNANVIPGYDFISDPENARDGDGRDPDAHDLGDYLGNRTSTWHGTHVAGTIAAVTNNRIGVAGVAPRAKVMPIRALGPFGGTFADILDAVTWASGGHVDGIPDIATPATVINMSLGGYTPEGCAGTVVQQVIDDALARGVSIVVAAGNDNANAKYFSPASCSGVITVGASAVDGGRSTLYSNFGEHITISAPGGNGYYITEPYDHFIWSLGNLGQFEPIPSPDGDAIVLMEGTSMAAPHVAGIVALMQSAAVEAGRRRWRPDEIKTLLKRTASPWAIAPSWDRYQGPGIANAAGAVLAARQNMPTEADTALPLSNRSAVGRQTATARESLLYKIEVPAGRSSLIVRTYGGVGDVDLYVSRGVVPTATSHQRKSMRVGNTEQVSYTAPAAGTYYVRVYARASFADLSILAAY